MIIEHPFTPRRIKLAWLFDSYKYSQHKQYPPGLEYLYSYMATRYSQDFINAVFFGIQYQLKQYFSEPFTKEDIMELKADVDKHMGLGVFHEKGFLDMLNDYGGYFPVEIKAVPEGTVLPLNAPMIDVVNTDKKYGWITNPLESFLVQNWYGTTVATQSRYIKEYLLGVAKSEGMDLSLVDFKLHDFGLRGVSSAESAGIGGLAHLTSFKGTDTFIACKFGQWFYHEDMAGFSIPASEHSTMTAWLRTGEAQAFANMLDQYPTGMAAVVSDQWDIKHACKEIWGNQLKQKVMEREGSVIIRFDSGNPIEEILLAGLDILGDQFGYGTNQKGFKILDPHVRVIQGDGIGRQSIKRITDYLHNAGWGLENYGYGSGGKLLQFLSRDELGINFKASHAIVDGEEREVFKEPITDPGKNSKKGRLALIQHDMGDYEVIDHLGVNDTVKDNILRPVYRDGQILVDDTFADIRARASF